MSREEGMGSQAPLIQAAPSRHHAACCYKSLLQVASTHQSLLQVLRSSSLHTYLTQSVEIHTSVMHVAISTMQYLKCHTLLTFVTCAPASRVYTHLTSLDSVHTRTDERLQATSRPLSDGVQGGGGMGGRGLGGEREGGRGRGGEGKTGVVRATGQQGWSIAEAGKSELRCKGHICKVQPRS